MPVLHLLPVLPVWLLCLLLAPSGLASAGESLLFNHKLPGAGLVVAGLVVAVMH